MKRLLLLICFISLCLPTLAWSDLGATESVKYLNKLVAPSIDSFMQTLLSDEARIEQIKRNLNIEPAEINKFAVACTNRNISLLNTYKTRYFKPAYNKYLEYDKTMSFEDFSESIAISEISSFYDFYGFTEANLRACEALTNR